MYFCRIFVSVLLSVFAYVVWFSVRQSVCLSCISSSIFLFFLNLKAFKLNCTKAYVDDITLMIRKKGQTQINYLLNKIPFTWCRSRISSPRTSVQSMMFNTTINRRMYLLSKNFPPLLRHLQTNKQKQSGNVFTVAHAIKKQQ